MDNAAHQNDFVGFTLRCYRRRGVWLFDEAVRRTQGDVLLIGSQSLVETLLREERIWPGSHHGFDLTFSKTPIDDAYLLTLTGRTGEGIAYAYKDQGGAVSGVLNAAVFSGGKSIPASLWVHLTRPQDKASLSVDLRSEAMTVTETVPPLDAALATLRAVLSNEHLDWLRSASDEQLADAHLGLGAQVRNALGLWKDSPLMAWFAEQGITHPDDVSESLLRTLRAQLLRVEQ